MEKRLEGTRHLYLETGANFLVDYYVLQSTVQLDSETTVYGIEAVKRVEDTIQEVSSIQFITEDQEEIYYLIDKMLGGAVTPYALGEILDEFVC